MTHCKFVINNQLSVTDKYELRVKVVGRTEHKIGHFGDVPQANLLAWCGKTKPNTTKARIHQSKKCTTTQDKLKQLKPGFSHLLRPPAWKLRGSNKQIIYIIPKSTKESSAQYARSLQGALTDKYTTVCK